MRSTIIAGVLLLLIVFLCIVNAFVTGNTVDALSAFTEADDVERLSAYWEKNRLLLSISVKADHMERVMISILDMQTLSGEEYDAAKKELLFHLKEIREIEQLGLAALLTVFTP